MLFMVYFLAAIIRDAINLTLHCLFFILTFVIANVPTPDNVN